MHEISKRIYDLLESSKDYSQAKLANHIGISRSTVTKWFNDEKEPKPSYENVEKAAEYFQVPTSYLWEGKNIEWEPTFTEKDERDVQKELEKTLNALQNDTGLMFDGEVLDDETRELLEASLEHAIRTAKITAKKKFTPNKYRK